MGNKKLIKFNNKESIEDFLRASSAAIAEFLTGVLSAGRSELKRSAGYLVQAVIKNNFFTQLGEEIRKYREEGKIKEDYFATNKNKATLFELLKFIDEEASDEEKFKAMKSIFFCSIEKDADEQREGLAYELMQICKQLSSQQILILKVVYNIAENEMDKIKEQRWSASIWLSFVSQKIGHNTPELIEMHEKKLMDLKLISPRVYSDMSGVNIGEHFRLTKLGYQLCQFIVRYE